MNLKNKTVLITGSSTGIGRETAYLFATAGCNVVVTYFTSKNEGEKVAAQCKKLGASGCLLVHLDVMKEQSIRDAVKKTVKQFGKIDILINNAAIIAWKPLEKQSLAEIKGQIRTNLEGYIVMTYLALPHITEMIINIGSGAGKTGYSQLTTYCATKFGVRGFTQALAEERADLKIYCVNPGMTATKMTGYKGRPPEQVAEVVFKTAQGVYKKPSGADIDIWDVLGKW